ncbi:uncharacterized protein RAG0_12753 [Rhynchosporium agropyri]|uniref:Apple domain-containing protein n=1 Tax=Rhynchosporium agropyri TaxID=914238 RepID=A0A1E1LBZ2_9HELO|nr:uncharacterized protein RAG0_12753 [Rhynchosporium agropyri]
MSSSRISCLAALCLIIKISLITSLTSALSLPRHRVLVKDEEGDGDMFGKVSTGTKMRRQDLVGLSSWTSPDFCYGTGQVRDVASLIVHPPPSMTLDYASLCSEVLHPTKIVSVTSTQIGDSVIIITATATHTTSTTTTEYSQYTTTALCPSPLSTTTTTSSSLRCAIPGLGFSINLLYHRAHISDIACHELCLSDEKCKSFQIVKQDDEVLGYTRCNVYETRVDGIMSEPGDGRAMFWDRACEGLSAPGCKDNPQNEERDEENEECYRLDRIPSITSDSEIGLDMQKPEGDEGTIFLLKDIVRVERDEPAIEEAVLRKDMDEGRRLARRGEMEPDLEDEGSVGTNEVNRVERGEVPGAVEDIFPINADERIRAERKVEVILTAEAAGSMDTNELLRIENEDALNIITDQSLLRTDQSITIEKRVHPFHSPQDKYKVRLETEKKTVLQAVGNGYMLSLQPVRKKRTPDDIVASPYRVPGPGEGVTDSDTDIEIDIPTSTISSYIGNARMEKFQHDNGPANPLITPPPRLPILILDVVGGERGGQKKEQGIRVEKRDTWTMPDFLVSFLPLFITLACSCLITSAVPMVTSSVTDTVQNWNYSTVS